MSLVGDPDEMTRICADIAAPERIIAHAILRGAAFGAEIEQLGIEGKVRTAHVQGSDGGFVRTGDDAAVSRRGPPDAVVGTPSQTIEKGLHVEPFHLAAESGEDGAFFVADSVAVGVLEVIEVRRSTDENPALVAEDRAGPLQLVFEDDALVELAVAVHVGEQAHLADLIVAAFRVADHFDDISAALFIEGHRDGIDHGRFVGGEGEVEARRDLEGRESIGRFRRGSAGEFLRRDLRFGRGLSVEGGSDRKNKQPCGEEAGDEDLHDGNFQSKEETRSREMAGSGKSGTCLGRGVWVLLSH